MRAGQACRIRDVGDPWRCCRRHARFRETNLHIEISRSSPSKAGESPSADSSSPVEREIIFRPAPYNGRKVALHLAQHQFTARFERFLANGVRVFTSRDSLMRIPRASSYPL